MSNEPTCRGSYVLGSACGNCARCRQEKFEMVRPPVQKAAVQSVATMIRADGSEEERLEQMFYRGVEWARTQDIESRSEVLALKVALNYYADKKNWEKMEFHWDEGNVARKALAHGQEKKVPRG